MIAYHPPRRFAVCGALLLLGSAAHAQKIEKVALRGHEQALHTYGSRAGDPVILSSGDGGWIHLAPHLAEVLAARGFYVVGLDVRAYLTSFTAGLVTLRPDEEPRDFRVLAQFARGASSNKPILVGVSEGAGLSVLAATDPATRGELRGVVGVGLPDVNELGWRWKDTLIYVTHKVPNEPTFSAAAVVRNMAPLPLAAIHSTHDEFVPIAEVQKVLQQAMGPKRLWTIDAADHRFSDKLEELDRTILEALRWVQGSAPR